ncbi:hypothetical protein O9929_08095 [Vibrio lentus]|nr:hypothetical protein [Vibrio lentus]
MLSMQHTTSSLTSVRTSRTTSTLSLKRGDKYGQAGNVEIVAQLLLKRRRAGSRSTLRFNSDYLID